MMIVMWCWVGLFMELWGKRREEKREGSWEGVGVGFNCVVLGFL